jgi:outer membrane protein TolC
VRAQQDVATSRAAIPGADEQLREAREGLAAVLQIPGDVGLAGEPDAIEQQIMAFCTPSNGEPGAPEKRIDVLIAEKEIDVAERNVDDIALKFVPTLTVQLSANATGLAFAGPFATGWSASGVLSIPLYDGGVRYGEMRDRKALVEEAKAKAVSAQVGAFIEIAQARRAIDVALAAQAAAREARDLAAEADRLQRIAYAAGIGTNFDLIDAGRTLRTAETQLILRDLDLASARLSLPFLQGNCTGTKSKE